MAFRDKQLKCRECGAEFRFSAQEQEFYRERGFQNEPQRCPDCRAARKREQGMGGGGGDRMSGGGGSRAFYDAVCADCGTPTQVPFQPTSGRPVYCRTCYLKRKG
jgi:CxxC-x17-CxxC domain-containing protein